MAPEGTYFCYACLQRHLTGSSIGRDHERFDIDADTSTSGTQAHLREFYLQTKGITAALQILGFGDLEIRPPRFGKGWPSRAAVEARYRRLVKRHHPDAGGNPDEFRKIRWAVEVLRRYRPLDADRG